LSSHHPSHQPPTQPLIYLAGAIASQESPITSVQMLWVNLIMDSLASLALATELPRDELLDLKPYSTQGSLITPTVTPPPQLSVGQELAG